LKDCSGKMYDPRVVKAFLQLIQEEAKGDTK
jgi:response regulator RpfG family c-di-GMP phosphodiesterase